MMSLRQLRRNINKQFLKTLSLARIYNPEIENYIYSNKTKYKAYCGYNSCGIFSYLLSYQIKKLYPDIDLTPGYSCYGYGKYLEDHICILTSYTFNRESDSDYIIIDPTYKQFLDSAFCDGESMYSKYLYKQLPPFFVGTKKDLEIIFDKLFDLESKLFNNTSINKKELMDWWKFNGLAPYQFDLYQLVNDKKPNHFLNKENELTNLGRIINYLKNN